MLFDLHVHTSLSPCGRMDIEDVLACAAERGLDGICITDHGTMDVRRVLDEGIQANGLCVIFGMEYSTAQGDFLVFGPFDELPEHLSAESLLRTVRDAGGVAAAAHPLRRERPVDEQLIRQGLCTVVESLNGRNTPRENQDVQRWLSRYDLIQCGGSDAHTLDELATFATRLLVPVQTRTELIRALQQGRCRPEIPNTGLTRHHQRSVRVA